VRRCTRRPWDAGDAAAAGLLATEVDNDELSTLVH